MNKIPMILALSALVGCEEREEVASVAVMHEVVVRAEPGTMIEPIAAGVPFVVYRCGGGGCSRVDLMYIEGELCDRAGDLGCESISGHAGEIRVFWWEHQ